MRFEPAPHYERLSAEQRAAAAANPELRSRFERAIADALAALVPIGVSWSGLTGHPDILPSSIFDCIANDLEIEAARASLAISDRRIIVVMEGPPGLETLTDLDTLCVTRGIDWCERAEIRAAVTAGRAYRGDNAGWTKLTDEFQVRAAANRKAVAA